MSGGKFANEDVMEDYMSALLTDEPIIEELHRQSVEQLLKAAPVPRTAPFEPPVKKLVEIEPVMAKVLPPKAEKKLIQEKKHLKVIVPEIPKTEFQVMLFEVAGITLAVPLIELGGIHQFDSINSLFGKPNWFSGVLIHREEKFNVVDTAKWIMPEKSAEKMAGSSEYQYLIVLGESGWGLGCEKLIATETLLPDDVKWRDVQRSRAWLSGMIKKKMCALVNVPQLINMLDQGLGSNN
jgi:purine-binding chemotaxis protein CheW